MAKIVSKHPSTSRWQLVHSPSAPGFDEGHHEKLIRMEVENYDFLRLVRGCLPLAVANGLDTRLRKHWVST